jgi:hypothetical protein
MIDTSCVTCKRTLNVPEDPLSTDCGGECWGCVGQTEAEMGYAPSIEKYNDEIDAGYRPGTKIKLLNGDKDG